MPDDGDDAAAFETSAETTDGLGGEGDFWDEEEDAAPFV